MTCPTARVLFPELLSQETFPTPQGLSDDLEAARLHVASCPDCRRELEALQLTLSRLDSLPEPVPSPELRRRFQASLVEEKLAIGAGRRAAATSGRRRTSWRQWALASMAASALLVAGFLLGSRSREHPQPVAQVETAGDGTRRELQELRAKVDRLEAMNELVAAAVQNQQQPANLRLRGVLASAMQENPGRSTLDELITSLALDSSANVRLRALDALFPHADREEVRAAVVAALSREPNPLVQVTIIDFVAATREREAVPALQRISADDLSDGSVREAARRALAEL